MGNTKRTHTFRKKGARCLEDIVLFVLSCFGSLSRSVWHPSPQGGKRGRVAGLPARLVPRDTPVVAILQAVLLAGRGQGHRLAAQRDHLSSSTRSQPARRPQAPWPAAPGQSFRRSAPVAGAAWTAPGFSAAAGGDGRVGWAYSGASRSPIPGEADHPFRTKPITDSGRSRSPITAKPIT